MAEPTILICVGAQKAGTSWLYSYLRGHPDVHLRGVKEMHYFDAMMDPEHTYYWQLHQRRASSLRRRLRGTAPWRHRDLRAKLRDNEDWLKIRPGEPGDHRSYLDYLSKGRRNRRLIGDVTPCYATLKRDDFRQMAELGDDVRMVYILRDPVDRVWSQARMMGKRRAEADRRQQSVAERNIDRFLRGEAEGFLSRSDYERSLTELTAVVPRDRLHFTFFEELFSEPALERLRGFLGLAPHAADTGRVQNQGVPMTLDADRKAQALALLRRQYDFCNEFFDGRLPERWQSRMAEA